MRNLGKLLNWAVENDVEIKIHVDKNYRLTIYQFHNKIAFTSLDIPGELAEGLDAVAARTWAMLRAGGYIKSQDQAKADIA